MVAGRGDPVELVDVTDGDTPNLRMPVRMLSVDTPEVTARSASSVSVVTTQEAGWVARPLCGFAVGSRPDKDSDR